MGPCVPWNVERKREKSTTRNNLQLWNWRGKKKHKKRKALPLSQRPLLPFILSLLSPPLFFFSSLSKFYKA
jgi:hypothetical protein